MKKSNRKRVNKRPHQAASGAARRAYRKAPKACCRGLMSQERRDRRSLDRQAERAAKTKRKL